MTEQINPIEIDNNTTEIVKNIETEQSNIENKTSVETPENKNIWNNYEKFGISNDGSMFNKPISDKNLFGTEQQNVMSNGKIEDIKQQELTDCWLLSSTKALAQTDIGKEAIKNAIDANHEGTAKDPYQITIFNTRGEKQTINVTKSDLVDKGYSVGDLDMNLIEAAVEKYFDSEGITAEDKLFPDRSISGKSNNVDKYSIGYMLTGKTGKGLTTENIAPKNKEYYSPMTKEAFDEMIKNFADNPNSTTLTCAFKPPSFIAKLFSSNNNAAQIENHEYYIKEVIKDDKGNPSKILYVNSWDTTIVYEKSYNNFFKNLAQIQGFTL